jgi:aspartate/methionine/tyrosine aminotransferase
MDISKYAKKELLQLAERPATRTPIPRTGDIINLGAGDPDFNQPPIIAEWIKEAIEAGATHYEFQGHPEFKRAVAEYYSKYGVKIDPETQVIPTSGGGTALFLTLAATINPGDEVIIPDPAYQGYINPIKYFGGKIVRAKMRKTEDGYFRPDIENIEKAATEKTKLMIICNPDNPTGCIYTMEELKEIARIATEKDFLILSDEIYNEYTWRGKKHTAIATIKEAEERTIIAMSLSKTFAWTGLRVGYIIAPKELAELIWRVPIGISPTPVPLQIAAAKMLREGWSFHKEMRREYEKRIEYSVKRLNEIPNIKCVHPEATFYLFPDITETGMKSTEYTQKLFEEERVRVVAGSTFGEMGEGHIRIALVAPIEKINEAINRIERLHKKLEKH